MLTVIEKALGSLKADKQKRARVIAEITRHFPELEVAIKSRNNKDFRLALVKVFRNAATEEAALFFADMVAPENQSAFLAFCYDGIFEGLGSRSKSQVTAPVDAAGIATLFGKVAPAKPETPAGAKSEEQESEPPSTPGGE